MREGFGACNAVSASSVSFLDSRPGTRDSRSHRLGPLSWPGQTTGGSMRRRDGRRLDYQGGTRTRLPRASVSPIRHRRRDQPAIGRVSPHPGAANATAGAAPPGRGGRGCRGRGRSPRGRSAAGRRGQHLDHLVRRDGHHGPSGPSCLAGEYSIGPRRCLIAVLGNGRCPRAWTWWPPPEPAGRSDSADRLSLAPPECGGRLSSFDPDAARWSQLRKVAACRDRASPARPGRPTLALHIVKTT